KLLETYPPEVREAAQEVLKRMNIDPAAQAARLAELAPVLEGGDAASGKKVYFGLKASCSACHQVGSEGGDIGPALTGIGKIRTPRDLLEAVVFPSASFARGFESYHVAVDT